MSGSPDLVEVRYEFTPRFPEILQHLHASVLVTTYQAGKLMVLGAYAGKLRIGFLSFNQPMGLAVGSAGFAVGARREIHFFGPAHETIDLSAPDNEHDGCFVPRSSHYTGNIHGHELAWGDDGLWVVNTLFSCLCTLHDQYSFVPRWRPPFVSRLIDQDRCHLNGLAMDRGRPRFVTVLGESDEPAGWRPNKAAGGCILDVSSGEIVARGLSMPHSPRCHHGRLWVLNSGCGHLSTVELGSGRLETIQAMPGYTRGLALAGQFAFVGLSKIRETNVFGGLPIAEQQPLRCGVGVVDLVTGRTMAVFQFLSGVDEIFAVDVIPGFTCPRVAGESIDGQEHDVWIVPGESVPAPAQSPVLPAFARPGSSVPEGLSPPQAGNGSELRATAQSLQAQGQLPEAAVCLEHAAAAAHFPAPILISLGNLHQEMDQQEQAIPVGLFSRPHHRPVESRPRPAAEPRILRSGGDIAPLPLRCDGRSLSAGGRLLLRIVAGRAAGV